MPSSQQLSDDMSRHFALGVAGEPLAKVAQVVEGRNGRQVLEAFVAERLDGYQPDATVKWLATRRWRAIFTTNYDDAIERAYDMTASPPQSPISIATTPQLSTIEAAFQVPIFHLHGMALGENKGRLILTQRDYATFREPRRMIFEVLKQQFAASTFLYIGYSNQDTNWTELLEEVQSEFYPKAIPVSYRVAPVTERLDVEILRAQQVETIDADLSTFVSLASAALQGVPERTRLGDLRSNVPLDLQTVFDRSPAATLRLLLSWEFVNSAPFDEQPNMADFLRGDPPNWALAGKNAPFERDLSELVFEALLDFLTSPGKRSAALLIVAPAGFGTTTMLRVLAARLVSERVGPVYALRPGAAVLEGTLNTLCKPTQLSARSSLLMMQQIAPRPLMRH
jgi:SIR2-like domain